MVEAVVHVVPLFVLTKMFPALFPEMAYWPLDEVCTEVPAVVLGWVQLESVQLLPAKHAKVIVCPVLWIESLKTVEASATGVLKVAENEVLEIVEMLSPEALAEV